jgi:hypothetical protein
MIRTNNGKDILTCNIIYVEVYIYIDASLKHIMNLRTIETLVYIIIWQVLYNIYFKL